MQFLLTISSIFQNKCYCWGSEYQRACPSTILQHNSQHLMQLGHLLINSSKDQLLSTYLNVQDSNCFSFGLSNLVFSWILMVREWGWSLRTWHQQFNISFRYRNTLISDCMSCYDIYKKNQIHNIDECYMFLLLLTNFNSSCNYLN